MEQTKTTYCRICEPNCGLKATVADGRLVKVAGDVNHPLSRGYICPRGLATLDIHQDPDRITHPMKRTENGWEKVGWDQALGDIGDRIKRIREKYGPDSVGLYFGNPIAFDFAFSSYMPVAIQTLGSANVFSAGTQDCNNKFAASERVFGSPLLHPVADVDAMDFLILWGSNPAVSKMSFTSLPRPEERLSAIEKRGGRVVIIDPRRTETAALFGEHVFIRPDTDVFLMLALLHVILSEGLFDKDIAAQHTTGLEDLKALAALYPPARAAAVTGVAPDVIEKLARDFAAAKNAGIHCSVGINQGTFGTLAYWLVQCLNTLTGRLDRKGSMIFCPGLMDFPRVYKLANTGRKRRFSRIGAYPSVMETLPAGVMADEILTPGKGQVKALIVVSGNPLLSVPDEAKLQKAFQSLELLVSLDLFINETGGMSHYVLPSQDFYEHWDFSWTGSMFNPIRFLIYSDAVVQAKGERKAIWIILHELLQAAGYPLAGNRVLGLAARLADKAGKLLGKKEPASFRPDLMLKAMLAWGGVSFKKLKQSGSGLLLPPVAPGDFFRKKIMTSDKKVHLAPPEFLAEKTALEEFFKKEEAYKGLKLIGTRQRRTHNTWFHNVESFVKKSVSNPVFLHPDDAKRLKIAEGDTVKVRSATGSIQLAARLTETLMPGVVCVPHGWGHSLPSGLETAKKYPGVNVNRLMASGAGALEKFAGQAILTGVPVTLEKPRKKRGSK